ncbi:MAG TPA: 2-succinyl-6-hydroxy-2,4-cyclohexadiene-1-carboxylate synthase [Balneolaceae bacterium]|nr:2-succinyl-6-hydroxy-2,4-cyclohexadiene-1-carboxylate synthase [Balneolaceae bacterium]
MKFIEIHNKSYACILHQRESKLPYLLMLHGFMGDHRVFDHLIKDLSEFCNPVTIDLLGHGKSSKPEQLDHYNETSQINDILGVIEKLDITPLFLFGYSMGGRLALKTALSSPQTFKGLILESTTCGIVDEYERKERRDNDEQRARQIEKNFEKFLSKWQNLELFQSPLPSSKKLTDHYRDIQHSQHPNAISASLRGFGTGSMAPACDQLKNLDLPVLLMAGTEDEKYQRINGFMAEQLPKATFSSIKAGHRTHLDNPKEFVSEINNFISSDKFRS